jgi:tetratricopeptide (TPR) repeat protein
MRRAVMMLITAFALVCTGEFADAQEETAIQIVYAHVLIGYGGGEINIEYANSLISSANENLENYNIRLEIWQDGISISPMLSIAVLIDNELLSTALGLGVFAPDRVITELTELSPALFHDYNPYVIYDYQVSNQINDTAHLPSLINLITGLILYAEGNCTEAVSYFHSVESYTRGESRTWDWIRNNKYADFYLGNCALARGEFEIAAELFESFLGDIDTPDDFFYNAGVLNNLAWTYLQVGREQEAFELMTNLVDAMEGGNFHHSRLLSQRAQLYALAFRYDEAIADMDAAIALDPENPELYVLRGNIIILIYEWDRALADYNTAIELDPNYADAYFYRGILYYTRADYAPALADFQHYLELAPDGIHAADATTYIAQIEQTQDALGN